MGPLLDCQFFFSKGHVMSMSVNLYLFAKMLSGAVPGLDSLLTTRNRRGLHNCRVSWWRPIHPPVGFLLAVSDNLLSLFAIFCNFDLKRNVPWLKYILC